MNGMTGMIWMTGTTRDDWDPLGMVGMTRDD